ncbi:MAG: HTH domain-containing protein [bacterium]
MKTDTANKIIEYIKEKKSVSAKDLAEYLEISRQAMFRQLARLLEGGKIYKIGKPPKVFYSLKEEKIKKIGDGIEINIGDSQIIENNFLIITPAGERKEGMDGFEYWCQRTGQPVSKTAKEYVKTFKKYDAFKEKGLISGIKKIKNTFPKVNLDNLFYLDFYSIERFGKTKLGQMLLYAKQSQDKKLIKELILYVKPQIEHLVKKYKITSIGFIPPTVKREVQFMKELEKKLNAAARKISIIKTKTEIAVPQKTLNKLEDRIENARETIIVDEKNAHKNILLIDDAVGSGATLNETAAKIKDKRICHGKIIGLALTGSFKGFDVISEV